MAQGLCAVCSIVLLLCACTGPDAPETELRSLAVDRSVQAWLAGDAVQSGDDVRTDPGGSASLAPVADMVGGLEARLREQPDDRQGWRLLARSYAYHGDMPRAASAAERAIALGADTDDMRAIIAAARTGRLR